MKNNKKKLLISLGLCILLLATTVIASAATNLLSSTTSQNRIKVHFLSKWGQPNVYYWNSLPENIKVDWPGVPMTSEGDNWYVYEFSNKDKINLIFNKDGNQTDDLTRTAGEWWYQDGKWLSSDPRIIKPTAHSDFREESIYFVITTRFFDGDPLNNVHCSENVNAKNTDADPEWRGDFKGLISKLDYIKAMGFSAIWITPVVENASGYDYHGYHAINFKKVDPRYESAGATYQDLIDACHLKGIKVIQDIVVNHTSNNGEEGLFPIMTKQNSLTGGVTKNSSVAVKKDVNGVLPSDYDTLTPTKQYLARDAAMKKSGLIYRNKVDINYEGPTVTTGQFAGDCMELNTENPTVYNYLTDAYNGYIDMGVDAFRIDTAKHVSRLTFNKVFLPAWKAEAAKKGNDNFYMFGEVASRVYDAWNHNNPNVTPCFYTWNENKNYAWNSNSTDGLDNLASTMQLYADNTEISSQRTSTNAFLSGNDYHTPDYSQSSGMAVIDYAMHFNFENASNAFSKALEEDKYFNDSTWSVTYVDSHDYGPSVNGTDDNRYAGGTAAWAENTNLLFTFRGIPCLYYGSEIEFKAGVKVDKGSSAPLEQTGRAYYGSNIEGSVTTTGYSEYSNATGAMATTLNSPLAKHIQRLNQIRRAIPALQKGQYSKEGVTGNMAFKRRFVDTKTNVDSFVCVAITDGATFTGIPSGTYVDAITGDTKQVSGSLTIPATGKGDMRVYVLQNSSTKTGKIGEAGTYLK